MDRPASRGLQYLPLPTAAALVYLGVRGMTLDATDSKRMQNVLNDIAHALANLAPIYSMRAGKATLVPAQELLEARFERGAHVLITTSGTQLRDLAVQRDSMQAAIQILRAARARFD